MRWAIDLRKVFYISHLQSKDADMLKHPPRSLTSDIHDLAPHSKLELSSQKRNTAGCGTLQVSALNPP
jgi:hypothetical protein